MEETINIVPKTNTELALTSANRLKDMWRKFEDNKSRNGTFVAFDDYRQSNGGRGLWGTKIFFRALIDLNFIEECALITLSKGKYCPSEFAMEKYGDMFRFDEEAKIWGLSQEHLDDFDKYILPAIISIGRKLEVRFAEEKKAKQHARYQARKAELKANEAIDTKGMI